MNVSFTTSLVPRIDVRSVARHLASALAVFAALGAMPALASDSPRLGAHHEPVASAETTTTWGIAGWPALAGLGLVAVAAGAATARRPRGRRHGGHRVSMPADRLPLLTLGPEPAPGLPSPPPHTADTDLPPSVLPDAAARARTYLAPHHLDLAIDMLRRHIETEVAAAPVAWLMLLDLYRTHGREQGFRDIAERFHERFNAQTPQWDQYPPDSAQPGLEAFPRLIKEISLCWGTHECRRVLDRLLYDNRDGRRAGFTLNAYNDLLALRRLSDALVETIEADFAEEATLRTAFAAAAAHLPVAKERATAAPARALTESEGNAASAQVLTAELVSQLDADLRRGGDTRSSLEIEHPALVGMLTREWGNSALAARLCEVLARCADAAHPLSPDAAADLATLGLVADELSCNAARDPSAER